MDDKRAFVEGLYGQYDLDKKPTKELAYMIKTVTNDSLTGEKYIYELLQNANDAARKVGAPVCVDFVISGDYLIFQHDGKPFDQDDVDGIASAANPNRKKVDDLEAIGHKGIGFKAVFTISDWVYIKSNGYTFRFDKFHEPWAQKTEHCPWQVIPIWTEDKDLPEGVAGVQDRKVVLILKLHPQEKEKIVEQLNVLMRNNSILLFLDHIKQINFKCDGTVDKSLVKEEVKVESYKTGNSLQTLEIQGEWGKSQWFIYQRQQAISEQVRGVLSRFDSVPKKYKTAPSIKISIAMRSDGTRLVPEDSDSQLFCYLPTSISFRLPFLVNADFFLETSRAYLKNDEASNVWHGFILGMVFETQFILLNHLGRKGSLGKSTLSMLANPKKINYGHLDSHQKSHSEVFNRGIATYKVVSSMSDSVALLKVKDAKIDTHRFVETFGPEGHRNFCVANDLTEGSVAVLRENGAGEIGPNEIVELLKKPEIASEIKNPQTNKELCEFLHKCYRAGIHVSPNPFEGLKKASFILNIRSELKSPFSDLALPNKSLKYALREVGFLNIVHPVLKGLSKEVCDTFGLAPITLEAVIAAANKNPDEIVFFTRKIFAWYKLKGLTEADWEKLQQLKVKTTSGTLRSTKECFLSDAYMPELALEALFEDGKNFLSPEYVEGVEQNEILLWREFFQKLKVSDKLNKENIRVFVHAINQEGARSKVRFLCIVMSYFKEQYDYYTAELAQGIAAVEIVTTGDECYLAKDCYLSDCYRPEMPLQALVPTLNYVSQTYLDAEDDITAEEWLQFFRALGVRSKLTCTVKDMTRPSLEAGSFLFKGYIGFLENSENLPVDAGLGRQLCSADTARFPRQHSVSGFIEVEFIEKIISSGVFWQMLHDNFNLLRQADSAATYRTLYTGRKVPSNVRYYVSYILKATYNKLASELYAPELLKHFTELELTGLSVAIAASVLSVEEQQFFGFRIQFSVSDAVVVLNRLSQAQNNDMRKITHLYRDIAKDESGTQIEEPCILLTEAGSFCSSRELIANASRFLQVTNAESKKRILKRPLDLTDDEFLVFCRKLNVTCLADSNVRVVCGNETQAPRFSELLMQKLPLLVLVDAHFHKIEKQDLENFSRDRIVELLSIIEKLRFVSTPVISLRYNDVVSEEVDCWYSASEQAIYFRDGNDPMILEEISKFIGIALQLKIEPDVLRYILFDNNEERVIRKLQNFHLSEDNITVSIQVVNRLVALEPEARQKEGKREPERVEENQQNKRSKSSQGEEIQELPSEQPDAQVHQKDKPSSSSGTYSAVSRSTLFGGRTGEHPKRDRESDKNGDEVADGGVQPPGEAKKARAAVQLSIDALTRKQRKEIGYKGELFVYQKITEHFQGRGYAIEENEEGFWARKGGKIKTIVWPNKKLKGESVLHYDFHITGGKQECYIEVKSSLWGQGEDSAVTLSSDEYEFMKDCATQKKQYRIYYAYNLRRLEEGGQPELKESKKPFQEKQESFRSKMVYEFNPFK